MKTIHTIRMIQESNCRWRIETENGIVLTEDLILPEREAEDYIKRYITSYYNWTYEMVYLKGGKHETR